MTMLGRLLVVAGLVCTLSGCINTEAVREEVREARKGPKFLDTEPTSIEDYSPHVSGMVWSYYVGVNAKPSAELTDLQRVKAGKDPDSFGYETTYPGTSTVTIEHFLIENNTLYIIDAGDSGEGFHAIKPMKPLLQFPAKQGSTWQWTGNGQTLAGEMRHTSAFHVDTDIQLKTRAGQFNVIRVEETQVPLDAEHQGVRCNLVTFYASGYGMVKQVSKLIQPDGTFERVEMELADATLLKDQKKKENP